MVARDWTMGMIFLSQTILGTLGNFSLLSHDLYLHFTGCKFRPTDLIIKHLTVANCLVILSRGVPQTMAALGMKHFLSDAGCKLVFYVHSVGRDVSIGSTCLLSISQAMTISPTHSRWMDLKVKALKCIGPSSILCWILNLTIDIIVPVHMTGKRSDKNITKKTDFGDCYLVSHGKYIDSLNAVLLLFRDVFFVGLMFWASSFMVFILYRHKQQVQYIHRTNISCRSSPESRAIHSILMLVSTFVSLCTLSSILHFFIAVLDNHSVWLVNTSALIAGSFLTVSPCILMSYYSRVPRPVVHTQG
nr:vomeronasal 1 receptor oryCunV1R1595 isoform X1 [Oryctolagus cuniculus]